jgi:hypothetical protein
MEDYRVGNSTGHQTQNAANPGMNVMCAGAQNNHIPFHYHDHVFLGHKNKANQNQHTNSIQNTKRQSHRQTKRTRI